MEKKERIIGVLIGLIIAVVFVGGSVKYFPKNNVDSTQNTVVIASESKENEEYDFITLKAEGEIRIVYHKDTKVMYTILRNRYGAVSMTVLVNADGSPMVYTE